MIDPALADLPAPTDPREAWDAPAFGQLASPAALDERVTRIVAPNAGPLTLDGTNTYVIGEPGSGEVVIVDPGPDSAEHLRAVERVVEARDTTCALILVTHRHHDHSAAARAWADHFSCLIAAPTADVAGDDGVLLTDGREFSHGGVHVTAVATPGHSSDHIAFRLDHGPLLTGDHVLGRGTSVVAAPDGDLAAYLDSLRRVLDLGPDALYPGHGPEMVEDAAAVVRFYLDHRRFREEQIVRLLEEGPQHTTRIVRRIYTDVDERLLPAAAASTRAALERLADNGIVSVDDGGTATLRDR